MTRLAFFVILATLYGCGSIVAIDAPDSSQTDLGASVVEDGGKLEVDSGDSGPATTTETHDAGASLPICDPQITHVDCPQPLCDCRDR